MQARITTYAAIGFMAAGVLVSTQHLKLPVQAAKPIEITPIENLRRSSFAAIEVTVHRVVDKDEIIVQDASGRIRVDLGNAIVSTLRPGQTMVIEGFVDKSAHTIAVDLRYFDEALDGEIKENPGSDRILRVIQPALILGSLS